MSRYHSLVCRLVSQRTYKALKHLAAGVAELLQPLSELKPLSEGRRWRVILVCAVALMLLVGGSVPAYVLNQVLNSDLPGGCLGAVRLSYPTLQVQSAVDPELTRILLHSLLEVAADLLRYVRLLHHFGLVDLVQRDVDARHLLHHRLGAWAGRVHLHRLVRVAELQLLYLLGQLAVLQLVVFQLLIQRVGLQLQLIELLPILLFLLRCVAEEGLRRGGLELSEPCFEFPAFVVACLNHIQQLGYALVESHYLLRFGARTNVSQQISFLPNLQLLLCVLKLLCQLGYHILLCGQRFGVLGPIQLPHLLYVDQCGLQIIAPVFEVVMQRLEVDVQVHDLIHDILPELFEQSRQFPNISHGSLHPPDLPHHPCPQRAFLHFRRHQLRAVSYAFGYVPPPLLLMVIRHHYCNCWRIPTDYRLVLWVYNIAGHMSTQSQKLEEQIEQQVKLYNELHKAHQQLVADRTSVIEQQNENDLVKKEFDLLGEDARIYKLTGPVLVPQTLKESRKTINGRIDLIRTQLKKVEELIKDNETRQSEKVAKISKLKEAYVKLTQGADTQ